MFKACIFDLDGTLVDTLPTVHYYCNRSLTHFGFSPVTMEQCQTLCRLSISEFYSRLLRMGGCPDGKVDDLKDLIRAYDLEIYSKDIYHLTRPYPGVLDLIQQLNELGVRTAVLTNKPAPLAEALMNDMFSGLFDVVAGQTPDSISKPDPRSLTNLIAALDLPQHVCLYAGDTDVDMITAHAAGVSKCAVTWGYQSTEELLQFSPDYIVNTSDQLLSIFQH